MRLFLLVVGLLCACLPGTAAAKPRFPYIAYIASDEAPLRSGPGEEHYATDLLDRGTKVEVHRHDPGGWYAVRPLPGSFSWVPARQVEMTDEPDIAEVTAADTVAWVGSRTTAVRSLKWQIELKPGDLVEVLGAKKVSVAEGEGEETCYKIAPPAGEFRWVQGKFVTRRGADELADEAGEMARIEKNIKLVGLDAPVEAAKTGEADPAAARATEPTVKEPAPAPNSAPALLKSDGFVPKKKRNGDEPTTAPPSVAPTEQPKAAADTTSQDADESPFEARVRELEVDLSLLVSQPPSTWHLAPLRQRAAQLVDGGKTALERGRARVLAEKIEEFATFARRQPTPAASPPTPTTSATPASTPTPAKPRGLIDAATAPIGSGVRGSEFAPDIDPRYDGIGWLMPVHSTTRSTPSYALQDNDGKVLQYVTPSPGLNLNRYLRTQVGIYGQKGYVPTLRTPHLTAQRIISLERHRK